VRRPITRMFPLPSAAMPCPSSPLSHDRFRHCGESPVCRRRSIRRCVLERFAFASDGSPGCRRIVNGWLETSAGQGGAAPGAMIEALRRRTPHGHTSGACRPTGQDRPRAKASPPLRSVHSASRSGLAESRVLDHQFHCDRLRFRSLDGNGPAQSITIGNAPPGTNPPVVRDPPVSGTLPSPGCPPPSSG
jgi:hypothetical protein